MNGRAKDKLNKILLDEIPTKPTGGIDIPAFRKGLWTGLRCTIMAQKKSNLISNIAIAGVFMLGIVIIALHVNWETAVTAVPISALIIKLLNGAS